MRRLVSPGWLAASGLALLALAFLGAYTLTSGDTFIVLPDRARPVEPIVSVEGRRPPPQGDGSIYFVNVVVRQATYLEKAFPGIADGAELVPAEVYNPTGASETVRRRESRQEMTFSQRIAAVVALRRLGYEPKVRAGVLVTAVAPGRPATGRLRTADVILAVDGEPVRTPAALKRRITATQGRPFVATVRRKSRRLRIRLRAVRDSDFGLVVGIRVGQSLTVNLPVRIRIDTGQVGGPSAGLAFALALMHEFGRNVTRGRRVVVTGALDLDGTVLPVGGIEQKVIGARRAGADLMLVPAGDNAQEARLAAHGLRILPVKSFRQALRVLATV